MAEIQGAMPHHVILEWLPASVAIPDFAAVTATADHAFAVLKFAELVKKNQGSPAEFQQCDYLIRQSLHHLNLDARQRFGHPINHTERANPLIIWCIERKACIKPDVGIFPHQWIVLEPLIK